MKRILPLILFSFFVSLTSMAQVSKKESDAAIQLLMSNRESIGVSEDLAKNLIVSSSYEDATSGIRYAYLQQTYMGIPVDRQLLVLAFRQGKLLSRNGFVNASAEKIANTTTGVPALSALSAVSSALANKGFSPAEGARIVNTNAKATEIEFNNMGVSRENVTAKLVWTPVEEMQAGKLAQTKLILSWQVYYIPKTNSDYWLLNVDATTGQVVAEVNLTDYDNFGIPHEHGDKVTALIKNNDPITNNTSPITFDIKKEKAPTATSPLIVNSATYRVVPFPAESPWAPGGTFALRTDPWTAAPGNATSLKWHTGAGGVNYDYTRGNNVWAYEDRTAPSNTGTVAKSAQSSTTPDPLTFDFVPDTTLSPTEKTIAPNQQFNITNLFYTTNVVHNIMYQYGFNEAGGNFQDDNQGRGGAGNDHVNAEAQDGSGSNNANFSTPADGSSGRMQMFLWNLNGTSPQKDGDVDKSIVVHEFAHGISNRLTGGPTQAGCLGNAESMGEGWSDFFALMLTQDWATSNVNTGFNTPRGVGLYALNGGNLFAGSAPGTGIRHFKYSTNPAVNNQVYLASLPSVVHDRGEIWCAALWEMTWEIIKQTGTIESNIYNASSLAGNIVALQLVTEGLKLQQCSPGFISGRNAILQADQNLYGGAHICAIKKAFAKRGMGAFASEGSTASATDQIPDFSYGTPTLTLTQNGVAGINEGQNIVYTHTVTTTCEAVTNYNVRDTLPLNVTFLTAPGGTYDNATRVVTWPVSLAAGATVNLILTVKINAGSYFPPLIIIDEPVASTTISPFWTTASTSVNVWTAHALRSQSAPNSFFSPNASLNSDQTLATTASFAIGATPPQLSFWHRYQTESTFDGAVLEISTNGGTSWTDIGEANMLQNPYNGTISSSFGNVLAGRRAWTGTIPAFVETKVNMLPFANQPTVKLRWRMASDNSVGSTGWNVDDINMKTVAVVFLRSSIFNGTNVRESFSDTVTVILPPGSPGCTTDPIVTSNADAGAGSLRQAVLDACPGSTITFNMASVTSPITLTTGEIIIDKNLTVQGPGANLLTISGNSASRIFTNTGTGNLINMNKLTLTAGNAVGALNTGRGGALVNSGSTLTLDSMIITGNTAANGGGLNNFGSGTLNILNTTVSNNSALTSSGGGMQNFAGSFTNITNSTFTGNTSNSSTGGGAIQMNGTGTLINSTFTGNTSSSNGDGGAISFNGTSLTITNSTIASNTSQGAGGGISRTGTNSVTIKNTIIANNVATGTGPDVNGIIVSGGYNIVGKNDGSTGFIQATDLTGTIATPLNPLLGPLANNLGFTETMALLTGSPAIDKGSAGVTTDQRGQIRPYDFLVISNATGGNGSDIGAFELQDVSGCTNNPIVTSNADAGVGTLRQAVLDACPGSTITFNMATVTSPITLTTGEIIINKNLTVQGPGASLLTVSGNNASRIFTNTGAGNLINIYKLTLTNGNGVAADANDRGGALVNDGATLTMDSLIIQNSTCVNGGGAFNTYNAGTTNLNNSSLLNNNAAGSGGAIQNFSTSYLNITNSTFSGNVANSFSAGGAIAANGYVSLLNSTFSGNTAPVGSGGAIFANGNLITITNCTMANNTSGLNGGAINHTSATKPANIKNTIFANNSAVGTGQDYNGTATSLGFNLVGKSDASIGFTDPTDLLGTIATPLDAKLGLLANNTGFTKTMALLTGSPAIDKGGAGTTTDQRGELRPFDFPAIPNATGGNGSDIGAYELQNAVMPVATATPASQTVCSGSAITTIVLTSDQPSTTYAWTRNNVATVTGIPANGSGDISGTLLNTTSAPVTVSFTIIPTASGLSGVAITATVTVNPTAVVNAVTNKTFCNSATTGAIAFSSPNTGGTVSYSWTNSNTAIGLSASGTGDLPSFTATNAGVAPVTATITVTLSFLNGGVTCSGTPVTFTITVNPTPTVNAITNQTVCVGTSTAAVNFTGAVTGTVYTWTNSNTAIGLGASGTGAIAAFTATNSTTAAITSTITVTPNFGTSPNICSGTPITFTITVNPVPTITCPGNISATSTIGACTAPVTYTATVTGTPAPVVTYTLSGATTGSGAGTGSGALFNIGVTTVTITAINSCATKTCSFTVTVIDAQPPTITAQPLTKTFCESTNASFTVATTNALSYQWQFYNGSAWVAVAGATTATLTISNITPSMNTYTYRLQVIGRCSSVTSSYATLFVAPKPIVSIISSQISLVPGDKFTLTAVTSGAGTYVWYRNGVIIPGLTGNQLPNGRIDDRATYKVTFTNLNGCSNTSADFTVGTIQTTKLFVYPNPSNGQFQIRFYNLPNEQATVYIYNAGGQIVFKRDVPTGLLPYSQIPVNIRNQASGTYVIKLINAAGKLLGNTQIIKQ